MDHKTVIPCLDCGKYLGSASNGVRDQPEPFGIDMAPRGKVDGNDVYASFCLECGEKHPELELLLVETQTTQTTH
jgi:hypothetical protein